MDVPKIVRIWKICLCLLVLIGASYTAVQSIGICQPEIITAEELGSVGKLKTTTTRDGGATAIVGSKLLWTFGDTLFNPKSVDGTNLRSSTAALADPVDPLNVSEPGDANGAPYALLPFTAEEITFNEANRKTNERIALWPGSVIADGKRGFIFYLKLKVKPGFLDYEFIGTGIAEIKEGATTAVRDPGLLFTVPEPTFDNAFLDGTTVYVYGDLGDKKQSFGIARVPLTQIRERTAYQFWNGSAWESDSKAAKAVLTGIPGGVSVSYNAFLKQYLAIHSEILSNWVVLRTADSPQGVWSTPIEAFTGLTPKENVNYAGREHPELVIENGRIIFISYYRPMRLFFGELRLVRVILGKKCA